MKTELNMMHGKGKPEQPYGLGDTTPDGGMVDWASVHCWAAQSTVIAHAYEDEESGSTVVRICITPEPDEPAYRPVTLYLYHDQWEDLCHMANTEVSRHRRDKQAELEAQPMPGDERTNQ